MFKIFFCIKSFISLLVLLASFTVYAQTDSSKQPNNQENKKGFRNNFIRVNQQASEELDKAADIIDKNISPRTEGFIESNQTQAFFVIGGDFDDRSNVESNFRFGLQLHLPRFEKYWKLKFANQDEKRERGQSSVVRSQRTRNTNDDIFLGVSFVKTWKGVDIDYKPQLAFKDGAGLDHSIDIQTEYNLGRFLFEPSLEFFANHDEGSGLSSEFKFRYRITDLFFIEQSNDGRFVFLEHELSVNHNYGFGYRHNDRLGFGTYYFRSFANSSIGGYRLSAFGYFLAMNYVLYKNMLYAELKPYIVYERDLNFERTNGVVLNFRVQF